MRHSRVHRGLQDLQPEIIPRITRYLNLTDHFTFCISLCGGVNTCFLDNARHHFRSRVSRLCTVWQGIYIEWIPDMMRIIDGKCAPVDINRPIVRREVEKLLGTFRTVIADEELDFAFSQFWITCVLSPGRKPFPPSPTAFAAGMSYLCFGFLDPAIIDTIADELPHISSLSIIVDEFHYLFGNIDHIPANITRCDRIKRLTLKILDLNIIPESVLEMFNLEELIVADTQVSVLPEDIGTRLPRLRVVGLCRCPIRTLPVSLLRRMEDYLAFTRHSIEAVNRFDIPIHIDYTAISARYLDRMLKPYEFDLLRAAYEDAEFF